MAEIRSARLESTLISSVGEAASARVVTAAKAQSPASAARRATIRFASFCVLGIEGLLSTVAAYLARLQVPAGRVGEPPVAQ